MKLRALALGTVIWLQLFRRLTATLKRLISARSTNLSSCRAAPFASARLQKPSSMTVSGTLSY